MSDTNYILFQDEKGVRHIEKLNTVERIEVIGFQRYSTLLGGTDSTEYPQEPNGSFPVISYDVFKDLFGKILTIVDATFDDGERKEAVKSLLKTSMSEWYDKNTGYTLKMSSALVKLPSDK